VERTVDLDLDLEAVTARMEDPPPARRRQHPEES
jgi:hypothetical protein